MVYTGAALW